MRFGGIRFHFRPLIFNTPKLGEFGGGEISHIFKNIINYLFSLMLIYLFFFCLDGGGGEESRGNERGMI